MSALAERIKQEAEEAVRKAERWQKMAELVDELGDEGIAEFAALVKKNGNGNGKPRTEGTPYGTAGIRRVAAERPGIWTMSEFKAAMQERGWFTSERSVENAVLRLVRRGEGRRVGKGRYVFPADFREGVEDESATSDGAGIPFTFE
jgi:hypothetical protein